MRTSLILIVAFAALSAPARAQDLDTSWRTYVNGRFGVAVDYPDVFSPSGAAPENGDGQTFKTADGAAQLTVYGGYNANKQTTAELMQAYKTAGVDYKYSKVGKTWFVLSGIKGPAIGYLRCNLGPSDVVGCFDIEYPSAEAAKWAPVVERLGRSLHIAG